MLKRFLAVGLCLTVASTAFAGATVDLVTVATYDGDPIEPSAGGGMWLGGDVFVVEAMLTASQNLKVRGMQIDYQASSDELILGEDFDTVNQHIDGIPNFAFDYSPIMLGGVLQQGTYPASGIGTFGSTTGEYTDFSNLLSGSPAIPFPAASIYNGATFNQLQVTAGVPWRMGGIRVQLPTAPGDYILDLLTPINLAGEVDLTDENFGMVLDFGFGGTGDPVRKWGSAVNSPDVHDTIVYSSARGAGGPLTFTVIPEPATLVLLGLGGLAAAARRRRS
ncbi:MAG: PEP-CTERM sorting domain-containing protein [Planctomycetes bacterium]|nr:PEP-CTERM sorting domain-containing protein [Planctomycetota bacterium]